MKLTIECTEEQANLIVKSLELAFRPLMNQWLDMAEWLANDTFTYDKNNPNNDKLFDIHIQNKEAIEEVLKAVGNINYPWHRTERRPSEKARNVCDIWSVIRHELYKKENPHWDQAWDVRVREPIQMGEIPLIKCEVELEERKNDE